jgi:hypothetical protein
MNMTKNRRASRVIVPLEHDRRWNASPGALKKDLVMIPGNLCPYKLAVSLGAARAVVDGLLQAAEPGRQGGIDPRRRMCCSRAGPRYEAYGQPAPQEKGRRRSDMHIRSLRQHTCLPPRVRIPPRAWRGYARDRISQARHAAVIGPSIVVRPDRWI